MSDKITAKMIRQAIVDLCDEREAIATSYGTRHGLVDRACKTQSQLNDLCEMIEQYAQQAAEEGVL